MEAPKILVVDDESRMRKLVRDFLEKKNFQVLEAGDGEEAMDIFYEEKDIALILLDVMMPKMDGWEVCREIRKNSKVPIIMLTARGDERDELLGFQSEDPGRQSGGDPSKDRTGRRRRCPVGRRDRDRQGGTSGIC